MVVVLLRYRKYRRIRRPIYYDSWQYRRKRLSEHYKELVTSQRNDEISQEDIALIHRKKSWFEKHEGKSQRLNIIKPL